MNLNRLVFSFLVVLAAIQIQGCPLMVAGAAGGTAIAVSDRRSAGTIVDDEAIEVKAMDLLYRDKELDKKIHVNVTSYNYVVLLSGEVLSQALEERVISTVRNIEKVRRVHNYLRVADLSSLSSRTNDSWITSKIRANMLAEKNFDSAHVKTVTESGVVYLMGIVTPSESKTAVNITRNVQGVTKVVKLFEYIDEPPAPAPSPAAPAGGQPAAAPQGA